MDTSKLKKFAQEARRKLLDQVETRLKAVLKDGSLARRENSVSVEALEKRIGDTSEQQVIEQAAYTWFNRFCALRFMDVNRYTPVGTVSPADGFLQPEILTEAKQGVIDENWKVDRKAVLGLLDGTKPSSDPQQEAYRLLLVGVCNHYNALMPFLFEEIADYTELLMPDDLLSDNSVLTDTRQAMYLENCSPEQTEQSVEVIGWLYQFYISEKKDDVFAALKKGKKITPENIPAATQLFTPHWIVRYLVENSLGRLWMLNHPDSKLVERMDYYIKPEEPESDFLRIGSPEEIKVCDPACGSGHMLTYAFDLLYAIYEEQGYQATEIPTLILTNNLFGIEIDQRAGALAAFALTMKAREKDRRFFTRKRTISEASLVARGSQLGVGPNICVLGNVHFKADELDDYIDQVGVNLFTSELRAVLTQWEEADNFGSLIRPLVTDVSEVLELLRERQMGEDLFLAGVNQKVLTALRQADYLNPKYHVVVANPPYMGSGGMNQTLTLWAKQHYVDSKSDAFAMFIQRSGELTLPKAYAALVTMQSWMFLLSFESLRNAVLDNRSILSLLQIGFNSFPELNSKVATACAFVVLNEKQSIPGAYFDLNDAPHTTNKEIHFLKKLSERMFFSVTAESLLAIPGHPIAFWATDSLRNAFKNGVSLREIADPKKGLATTDNNRFLRLWFEVSERTFGVGYKTRDDALASGKKWFPLNKGGGFRKWYGNQEYVINWANDGEELKKAVVMRYGGGSYSKEIRSEDKYFQDGITWSALTSNAASFRLTDYGALFDSAGSTMVCHGNRNCILAFLNTPVARNVLEAINPTLNFGAGTIASIPIIEAKNSEIVSQTTQDLVLGAMYDWNSFETSWGFSDLEILKSGCSANRVSIRFETLRERLRQRVNDFVEKESMICNEFASAYGLSAEVEATIPIRDVTLYANPHYRYDDGKSESELEALLLADTMREFVSYAVGCMLGRYSLDAPGLILANQGDTVEDYRRIIAEKRAASSETREDLSFKPDEDNVIPILDGDWFPDDITERFKRFLKVAFGEEHFEENLRFLEDAIYPDNADAKTRKTVRDYFLKDFYGQHVKMYKKRPIYWLFSSPKGTFNALIYMHRYRPDTVSVVLKYLRDFQTKLQAHKQHLQSIADSSDAKKADKTKALKEITQLTKDLKELEDYERKVIYPLASERREIDLDDGVKHNYPLFGEALKKIPGLDAKEDE